MVNTHTHTFPHALANAKLNPTMIEAAWQQGCAVSIHTKSAAEGDGQEKSFLVCHMGCCGGFLTWSIYRLFRSATVRHQRRHRRAEFQARTAAVALRWLAWLQHSTAMMVRSLRMQFACEMGHNSANLSYLITVAAAAAATTRSNRTGFSMVCSELWCGDRYAITCSQRDFFCGFMEKR